MEEIVLAIIIVIAIYTIITILLCCKDLRNSSNIEPFEE